MNKLIIFVFLLCGFFAACNTSDVKKAVSYKQQLEQSKACSADSDCVAVRKGCCECDGQTAVNKKHAETLAKLHAENCAAVPCTLQLCYTDIETACVNNICTAKPKSR